MSAARTPTLARRILFALVAIPALIVGLLAMHAMSTETAIASDPHVVVQALADPPAVTAVDGAPAALVGTSCTSSCKTVHDIVLVSCILVLVGGLLLIIPFVAPSLGAAVARALRSFAASPRAQLPDVSLLVLSISRT